MGQVLEVNAERRDRLQAHGDYTVAAEQQLSDIWHKTLRIPAENTAGGDISAKSIKYGILFRLIYILSACGIIALLYGGLCMT